MRGLQGTTDTVKLVVSISLLLFMIGLAQLIWEPGVSRPMAKFFQSSTPIDLGPTTITFHQAITIGVAILVAIGLRLVLTRFRIGIAMRAAVDDRPLVDAERRPPRPRVDARLGDRHLARRARRHPHRPRRRARRAVALACSSSARTRPRSSGGSAACRSRSSARSSSASPRATSPATSRRTSTCRGLRIASPGDHPVHRAAGPAQPAPAGPHDPQPRVLPDCRRSAARSVFAGVVVFGGVVWRRRCRRPT